MTRKIFTYFNLFLFLLVINYSSANALTPTLPPTANFATFSLAPQLTTSITQDTIITGMLNTNGNAITGMQILAYFTYSDPISPLIPTTTSSTILVSSTRLNCLTNKISHDATNKRYNITIGCITPADLSQLFVSNSNEPIFSFTLSPDHPGSVVIQFDQVLSKVELLNGTNILSPIPSYTYSSNIVPTPTIRSYGSCTGTDTSTCNFPVCPGGCDICRGTPACQNNLCVLAPVANGTTCFVPISFDQGNCFNGTCQAPATPAPTKTPVPPTPTSVPPTQIPTPTLVIPSPTPISVSTPIDLEISFQGSANLNSIQPGVSVTIKQNNQLVYSNPVVPFTSYYQLTGASTYRGSVYIPNENFSTGSAEIIIKGPAHLAKKFTVNLIKSQTNSFDLSSVATLKAGDLWGPAGQPDNTIQLGDITAFISQWTQVSLPITPSNYLYDLNLDGTINIVDMSLILSNWGTSSPIIFGDN